MATFRVAMASFPALCPPKKTNLALDAGRFFGLTIHPLARP